MYIRQEKISDYDEVYELMKTSFATASYADGTEADYLNDIRKKDTFIPELSLVALHESGKIIGQIVLYETKITMPEKSLIELVISPICVHPDYFRRGIARALIKQALALAKAKGYTAVFLCGEPEIYRKLALFPLLNTAFITSTIRNETSNGAWRMSWWTGRCQA